MNVLTKGRTDAATAGNEWARFADSILIPAGVTLLMVALATVIVRAFTGTPQAAKLVSIVYLVPVLLAALRWGTWPAILAALAGALATDFFFYPPLYSLRIEDPQNVADLVVYLMVAFVSGNLTASLRRRERRLQDLHDFSRRLVACFTTSDLIRATQDYLSQSLGRPAVLVERRYVETELPADVGIPQNVARAAKTMIARNGRFARTIFDHASGHTWLMRTVPLGPIEYVVFADLGRSVFGAKYRLNRYIDSILTDAAENLTRLDLAEAIEEFRLQAQSDALKSALVATMSHDLRNPLVSIVGAASVLDHVTAIRQDAQARALVGTIHGEATRLDSNIKNLVDAARITTGSERPSPELTDVVDMVGVAIDQKATQLAGRRVDVSLASDLPLVRVQAALIENALAQLLDNAAKYSAPGSTITITGAREQDWVVLSVRDQGAGLTPDEVSHVGRRSFRSARHAAAVSGSGLGLWIANTFVAANGGRLDAESAGPGLGTTVRIRLPVARAAIGT